MGTWQAARAVIAAACLLAGALAAPARAGENEPKVPKVPAFDVVLTGYVVQPSGKSLPLGETKIVKEHDIVLSGSLFWFNTAKTTDSITIRAVDSDFTIPAGKALRLAARAVGGDLATLPSAAVTYCEEFRHDLVKGWAQLATVGIASLGARLQSDTMTCVVDSDRNGDFDKAFIVGTKRSEDRHLVDIAPVKYVSTYIDPVAGDSKLELEFLDGGMLSGPGFGMKLIINGQSASFAALHFFPLQGYSRARIRTNPYQGIKLKNLPWSVGLAGGQVEVTAFDKASKSATVRVVSDIGLRGFVIEPHPTYIYIYY